MQKRLVYYLITALLFIVAVAFGIEQSCFFNSAYSVFKDLLEPLIAIAGLIIAYPFLKKKLIENHITNALSTIQDTNRIVLVECQKLIDKYIDLKLKEVFISVQEVESSSKEILDVYHKAQLASSDVVTLLFYLKRTLQVFYRNYNDKELSFLTSHMYYPFLIGTLENVVFYCSKAVPTPVSTDTEKVNPIHEKLRLYISHGDYIRYKDFNQGFFLEPNSAQFLLLYQNVNRTEISQLKRAAYQIQSSPAPVALLLHLHEIYAPLFLEEPEGINYFGKIMTSTLHLIGFNIKTQNDLSNGTSKKIVELNYSNISDAVNIVQGLKEETFINNYKDAFLPDSGFELEELTKYSTTYNEVIILQFDYDFLHDEYKKVVNKLKDKLKGF